MDKGMDRDLSLQLVDLLSDCNDLLIIINDNNFAPHILEQPTDSVTAISYSATFSIVAVNVKSYQWQYKASEDAETWSNLGGSSTTDTFTVNVTEARYAWRIRCAVTGIDNSVIYSDIVKIVQPDT